MPMNEYGEIIRNSSRQPVPSSNNGNRNSGNKSSIIFLIIGIGILIVIILGLISITGNNKDTGNIENHNVSQDVSSANGTTDNISDELQSDVIYNWNLTTSLSADTELISEIYGDTCVVETQNGLKATFFDGDNDYISCGTGFNLTDFWTFHTTICCQDISKEYSAFFAKYETNSYGPYAFSVRDGKINCWFTDQNGGHVELESNRSISNNEWVDIIVTKDNQHICLYLNGEMDAETDVNCITESKDMVTIGRQELMFEPYEDLQFTGYISEISIYERTLDDTEIQRIVEKNGFLSGVEGIEKSTVSTESPFEQKYWVIFTEEYRDNRVEAATINSSLPADKLYFIWDSSVELNDTTSSDECMQFFLNGVDEWEFIGTYHRMTDGATNVLASNLDVYDSDGNLLIKGCPYSEIDWTNITQYQ